MSIEDYSYIATMGRNCMPSFQLTRAAWRLRLPTDRVSGPFDWFGLDLEQAIHVIKSNFRHYFDPQRVKVGPHHGEYWRAADDSGIVSWHHLQRTGGEAAPSANSWFNFGTWLGRRLAFWERAMSNPRSSVLVVRLSDAAVPDDAVALERLHSVLNDRAAGRIVLAAVAFSAPLPLEHPHIKTFAVQPSWPDTMDPRRVDWDRDYGFGAAWKGHNGSWDAIWEAV